MAYYPRLRDLREDADLTQDELVKQLGMHKTTYTNYEQGKREPPFELIIRLAKLYGVSIDYIAGLAPRPMPLPPQKQKFRILYPPPEIIANAIFLAGVFFMNKKWWGTLGGFGAGVINGLLGAGGGMVAVPLLSALGVRGKKSHATALMVIVPLSLVSAVLYLVQGRVTVMDALPWLPGSLLGAYLGSRLMPKISTGWLKLVFGGLMLWGGIRLL